MGLSPAHTSDKLKSIFAPATKAVGLTDNSDGLVSRHRIAEVTADRVSEANMDLSLSAVWEDESPKSTNFGVFPKTELLAKFILLLGLTFATSEETVSTLLTPLK